MGTRGWSQQGCLTLLVCAASAAATAAAAGTERHAAGGAPVVVPEVAFGQWFDGNLVVVNRRGVIVPESADIQWVNDVSPHVVAAGLGGGSFAAPAAAPATVYVGRYASVLTNVKDDDTILTVLGGVNLKKVSVSDTVEVAVTVLKSTSAYEGKVVKLKADAPAGVMITNEPVTIKDDVAMLKLRFSTVSGPTPLTLSFIIVDNSDVVLAEVKGNVAVTTIKIECDVDKSCSGHGTCTPVFGCICKADDVEGYWAGATCNECQPNYGGLKCTKACRWFEGQVCGGHGVCRTDAEAVCDCVGNVVVGYWAGPACQECAADYYGSRCTRKCAGCANNDPCFTDIKREGDGCVCPPDHERKNGTCVCRAGRWGSQCANDCPWGTAPGGESAVCSNHGTCQADGTCKCAQFYFTRDCSLRCPATPGTPGTPCSGHGTCSDGAAGACTCPGSAGSCDCETGWAGKECGDCAAGYFGASCQFACEHGRLDVGGYGCVCEATWGGDKCGAQCPEHGGAPCGKGTCTAKWRVTPSCACDTDWYASVEGGACDRLCTVCEADKICSQRGECNCPDDDVRGHFMPVSDGEACGKCKEGYYGAKCEKCSPLYIGEACDVYNHAPKQTGMYPSGIATRDSPGGTVMAALPAEDRLVAGNTEVIGFFNLYGRAEKVYERNLCAANGGGGAETVLVWTHSSSVFVLANAGPTGTCASKEGPVIHKATKTADKYEVDSFKREVGATPKEDQALAAVASRDGKVVYALLFRKNGTELRVHNVADACAAQGASGASCVKSVPLTYTATALALREGAQPKLFVAGKYNNRAKVFVLSVDNLMDPKKDEQIPLAAAVDVVEGCFRDCSIEQMYIDNTQGASSDAPESLYVTYKRIVSKTTVVFLKRFDVATSRTAQLALGRTVVGREERRLLGAGKSTALAVDPLSSDVLVASRASADGGQGVARITRFRGGGSGVQLSLAGETKQNRQALSLLAVDATRTLYSLQMDAEVGATGGAIATYLLYHVTQVVPEGFDTRGGLIGVIGSGFGSIRDISAATGNYPLRVKLGGKQEYTGVVVNDTFATFLAGEQELGSLEDCTGQALEVTLSEDEAFTSDKHRVLRWATPTIDFVLPNYVLEDRGGVVTVTGTGFENSAFLACRYFYSAAPNPPVHYYTHSGVHEYWALRDKYFSASSLGELVVGSSGITFVNSTTVQCKAPTVKRASGIDTLEVTLDGQSFATTPFKVVGRRAKLGIEFEGETLLFTRNTSLVTLPEIKVSTLDSADNAVGEESDPSDVILVRVSIGYVAATTNNTAFVPHDGSCIPDHSCFADGSPLLQGGVRAEGEHFIPLIKGKGKIDAGSTWACLMRGNLTISAEAVDPVTRVPYPSGHEDELRTPEDRRLEVIAGDVHTLVFKKGEETTMPCLVTQESDVDASTEVLVTVLVADAAGNVIDAKRLLELGVGPQRPVNVKVFTPTREMGSVGAPHPTVEPLEPQISSEVKIQLALPHSRRKGWNVTFESTYVSQYSGVKRMGMNMLVGITGACPAGDFYTEEGCLECPSNADCGPWLDPATNRTASTVMPRKGFWSFPGSSFIYRCPSPESCTGGKPAAAADFCLEGSGGPLCSVCEEGFAKSGSTSPCKRCDGDVAILVLFLVFGFVLFAGYSLITLQQGVSSQKSIVFRMIFSHVQVLSALLVLSIPWTETVTWPTWRGFLRTSDTSNFNVANQHQLACLVSSMWRYIMTMCLPLLFVPLSLVVFAMTRCYAWRTQSAGEDTKEGDWTVQEETKVRKREELREKGKLENKVSDYSLGDILIVVGVVVFFLLYQMLAIQSSSMISCTTLKTDADENGRNIQEIKQVSFMKTDMKVSCDSSTYKGMKAMATSFLLVYGLGVPMLLCRAVIDYRKHHSEQATQMVFTFFVGGFKGKMFKFWQCVVMLRKLCVVVALAFVNAATNASEASHAERTRVYVLIWILTFFLFLQVRFKPYLSGTHNLAETVAQFVLVATLNIGLLFFLHPKHSATEATIKEGFFEIALGIVITMNVAVFVYFGWLLFQAFKTDTKARLGVAEDEDLAVALKKHILETAERYVVLPKGPGPAETVDGDEADTDAKEVESVAQKSELEQQLAHRETAKRLEEERRRNERDAKQRVEDEKRTLQQQARQRQLDKHLVVADLSHAVPRKTTLLLHKVRLGKGGGGGGSGGNVVYKRRVAKVEGAGADERVSLSDEAERHAPLFIYSSELEDVTVVSEPGNIGGASVADDGSSEGEDEEEEDEEEWVFRVAVASGKEYTFTAESQKDMLSWVSFFRRRVDERKLSAPRAAMDDSDSDDASGRNASKSQVAAFSLREDASPGLLGLLDHALLPAMSEVTRRKDRAPGKTPPP